MSNAAYNRGTAQLRSQIDAKARPVAYVMMDEINALPKAPGAATPFGETRITTGNGGFWIECPVTGFGFWYKTLRAAVRGWNISLTGYDETTNTWTAEPNQ